jgi:putative DNA primase/helicase
LNSGHTRGTASVLRCVGDNSNNYQAKRFSTWAPIVIARIGELNAALKSRSIEIRMQRARPDELVERFTSKITPQLKKLHDECEHWAKQHADHLRDADPEMPKRFHGRLGDNWRPLFAIADLAGDGWHERALDAAKRVSGDLELPEGVQLLKQIRQVFAELAGDRLSSADLCAALCKLGDGEFWVPASLAKALKPFSIHPRGIRIGDATPRGYLRSDFEDAFGQYLESADDRQDPASFPQTATAQQARDQ